jgi:ankyrin repeat protein
MMPYPSRAYSATYTWHTYCKAVAYASLMLPYLHASVCRLASGASPHAVDSEGNTALHCTVHCNYESGYTTKFRLARLLLNFGADPRTETFVERNNVLHKLFLNAGKEKADFILVNNICEYRSINHLLTTGQKLRSFGTDPTTKHLLEARNSEGLTPFDVSG